MTRRLTGVLTVALLLVADTAPVWAQRYRPPPPPPPIRSYGGGGGGGGGGARTLPSNPRPRPTPSGPSRTTSGPSRTSRPANDNARRAAGGAGSSTVRRVTPLSTSGVTRNSVSGNVVRPAPIPAKTSPQVQQARANARTRLTNLRLLRQRQAAARLAKRKQDQLAFETRAREEDERRRERTRAADLATATAMAAGAATTVAAGGGRGGSRGGPPPVANDNVRLAPGTRPAYLTKDIEGGFKYTSTWRDGDYEYEEISGPLKPPSEVQAVRSRSAQSAMSRGTGDHAGHRIAAKFGGPEDARNMSLQNANVNTYAPKDLQERFGGKAGSYKQMEDDWERKLEVGIKIDVSVRDRYRPGDPRPISRTVRWTETYQDGEKVEREVIYLNPESPQSRGDVP